MTELTDFHDAAPESTSAPERAPERVPKSALKSTPAPVSVSQEIAPMSAPAAATSSQDIPLSLDEFCRRLSLEDRRSVLIGGFHLIMRRANRLKDTDAAYRAAFQQFVHS